MNFIRKTTVVIVLFSILPRAFCECQNGVLIEPDPRDPNNTSLLTESLKARIVLAHNLYRSCVATKNSLPHCSQYGTKNDQPGAKIMREMQWDDDLAEMAQNWVNRCQFAHEEIQQSFPYYGDVGSNLAWNPGPQYLTHDENYPPVFNDLKAWFDEHESFTYRQMESGECASINNVCHYTQMVWDITDKVGCGYSYHRRREPGRPYVRYFACYYSPIGNYPGDYPYKKGTPTCSKLFKPGTIEGLCVLKRHRRVNK